MSSPVIRRAIRVLLACILLVGALEAAIFGWPIVQVFVGFPPPLWIWFVFGGLLSLVIILARRIFGGALLTEFSALVLLSALLLAVIGERVLTMKVGAKMLEYFHGHALPPGLTIIRANSGQWLDPTTAIEIRCKTLDACTTLLEGFTPLADAKTLPAPTDWAIDYTRWAARPDIRLHHRHWVLDEKRSINLYIFFDASRREILYLKHYIVGT